MTPCAVYILDTHGESLSLTRGNVTVIAPQATDELEAQNAAVVELRELLRTSEASVATLRDSERELKVRVGSIVMRGRMSTTQGDNLRFRLS